MTKLSILDQSPIISGHSPVEAIHATVELAQAADQLGFERYWLAEHHGLNALADPCPEILLTRLGSVTKHIRIGTGGILLPYYSPFKVAEQFRMLEALFPGRIDLGIGRAPGGDMRTAQAVMGSTTGGSYNAAEYFPQQVMELIGHFDGVLAPDHPHAQVVLQPQCAADDKNGAPQIWILGSSDYGGAMAAHLGLRFAFAHFINAYSGAQVGQAYKADFKPAAHAQDSRGAVTAKAYSAVAVFAIAADTQAEADELAMSVDVRRLQMAYGINAPIATVEEAKARAQHYAPRDLAIIERERPRSIIGTPGDVAARIRAVQEQFQADEVVVLSVAASYQARLHSYELLAREFGLKSR
jgi:luciferase family oxidoreductase group 1